MWPLIFVAWAPLLVAVRAGAVGVGGVAGFTSGFVFFLVSLRWIGLTSPLGLVVVSLFLAMFFAFAGAATAVLHDRPLLVPFVWVATEWMRGFLFGGFGWGSFGYALASAPSLAQLASVGGVPILGLVIVGTNVAIARAFETRKPSFGLALPVALYLVGASSPRASSDGSMRIAVVDAAIDPRAKWATGGTWVALTRHGNLTDAIAREHPALIVWPETALPTPLDAPESLSIRKAALERRVAQSWHAPLLVGVPEALPDGRFFNAVAAITPSDASIVYRKRRLVPFGELAPAKWLPHVLPGPEFVPGDGGPPIELAGARVGALVCFDDVFPAEASARAEDADVLVLLTNDAWLGESGAAQHLDVAILRAIETRRTVVRAANGGVIGAIGPDGRPLGLSRPGPAALVVDAPLLRARTLHTRAPELVPILCLVIAAFGVALTVADRGARKSPATSAERRLPPSRRSVSRPRG